MKKTKQNQEYTHLVYASVICGMAVFIPEICFATGRFDINAGIEAAAGPLIDAVENHWGKGVLVGGGATALVGEGDARQRAIRAGMGCVMAGAVVLGLLAIFKG